MIVNDMEVTVTTVLGEAYHTFSLVSTMLNQIIVEPTNASTTYSVHIISNKNTVKWDLLNYKKVLNEGPLDLATRGPVTVKIFDVSNDEDFKITLSTIDRYA
jgi:hypothetical protein